ncbi:toxin-antitoxin system, toxin component [Streptomyces venezuelae]|uniref:toxin-antitoxin system, toxin component n=1 Tax=Streptomyces venezuelae TaxID=54571 RepID=UPI00378FBD92
MDALQSGRTVFVLRRDTRALLRELVEGVSHLQAPVEADELCRALCTTMARRRNREIEFRTSSFPPGTASGLWLDLGVRDVVVVEERTAPVQKVVITGHELRHMDQGHCSRHVIQGNVATRLFSYDTDLQATVNAVLAVTGHPAPATGAHRKTAVREHARHESDADHFGLLLASRVRPKLNGASCHRAVPGDLIADRIETALGYHGPRD